MVWRRVRTSQMTWEWQQVPDTIMPVLTWAVVMADGAEYEVKANNKFDAGMAGYEAWIRDHLGLDYRLHEWAHMSDDDAIAAIVRRDFDLPIYSIRLLPPVG